MERWRAALKVSPGYVRRNLVFVAISEGELAGFYALIGRGRRVELDHLWVLPEKIGSGLGRALFEHAMGKAAGLGAEEVGIEADPNAEGFYRHMGARRVGEQVYGIAGQERVLPLLAVDVSGRLWAG